MPPSTTGQIPVGPVAATSLGRQSPDRSPLQAGQIYRARVEKVDVDGSFLLKVGGHTLRLAAGMSLVPGQELLIRMTTPGASPSFSVMRVLPPGQDEAGNPRPVNDAVVNALQVMATRQQPLAGLLAWLARFRGTAAEAPLAALLGRFSSPRELVQPQRLQGAMRDSGLLLEPRLAAAAANPAELPAALDGDFKLMLWQLLGNGGELDEGLADILEGLLAHISLRQLRSVRQAEDGHFYWSLELPLAWGDRLLPVSITLRRERGLITPENPEQNSWEVEFSLEAEPLGSLDVHIFLKDQQVSVSLEAERPDAVSALHEDIETLREALSLQGFHVESVVSRPSAEEAGNPAAREFSAVSALGGQS